MRDQVDKLIDQVCARLGLTYGGFHTLEPGVLDGEKCPLISFQVLVGGERKVYFSLVGSGGTEVRDDAAKVLARYPDLTKDSVFG